MPSKRPVRPAPSRKPTKKPAKPQSSRATRKAAAKVKAIARPRPKRVEGEAPLEQKALPAGKTFPIEIDPKRIEETLSKIGEEISHWAKKGRYTKVRFKFRGKQLLPDLPLAAVVAAEGLTFYWGGILRALLLHVGAGAVFGVELVNDSEKKVQAGKEKLLRGDLDGALELFELARSMDRDNANVHLNLGIALKLKGDREGARLALERARALDPHGAIGGEAEKVLSSIPSQAVVTTFPKPGANDFPSGAV